MAKYRSIETAVRVSTEVIQNSELVDPLMVHKVSPKTQALQKADVAIRGIPMIACSKSATARLARNIPVTSRKGGYRDITNKVIRFPSTAIRIIPIIAIPVASAMSSDIFT